MTKKRLRRHRAELARQRERAERYIKPEPYSRSDEYRFGVRSKR